VKYVRSAFIKENIASEATAKTDGFEAIDAAQKEARFQAWLASR
jgi:hypothetical protein